MYYANSDDIAKCKEIVREELRKANKEMDDAFLGKVTSDIMNISYSKGGDYSEEIIRSFAMLYIDRFL